MNIQPITAPIDQWKRYKAAKARAAAAKREADAFLTVWGIQEADIYAKRYNLAETDTLEIPVQDGNGQAIGKLTVSHRDACEVSAHWRKQVS